MINTILLINHEIDSGYWKEWELFKLPGGITGFLVLHFPLLFVLLYGLVEVFEHTETGLMFSLLLSFIGIFAFVIHSYFIRKGREEFNTRTSLALLAGILVVSVVQVLVTIMLLLG